MKRKLISVIAAAGLAWVCAAGCDKPAANQPEGSPSAAQPAESAAPTTQPSDATAAAAVPAEADGRVPVGLQLPKALFSGTPKDVVKGTTVDPATVGRPPIPLLAPPDVVNLALRRPVTSSDPEPIVGELAMITDGNKEGAEGNWVELGPGTQWVQIDLGQPSDIYGIVLWHYHKEARVYHDVVVQISDNAEFSTGVKTVYNNDHDNSARLGQGADREYVDGYEGKRIGMKEGARGRYVRIYSTGSTSDEQNHYIEVEVYGLPVK